MEKKMTTTIRPVDFVVFLLRKYAPPGSLMLDIGCGAAPYRRSTDARYVGLDITTEPYKENCPRDVNVVGSAMELCFSDDTFDLVFSVSSFYLLQDPAAALMECHRVLRREGRLILFDYNRRIQKILQKRDGIRKPCWTQWALKHLVRQAGYGAVEILAPWPREMRGTEKFLRLLEEEIRGQWAIVTGVK